MHTGVWFTVISVGCYSGRGSELRTKMGKSLVPDYGSTIRAAAAVFPYAAKYAFYADSLICTTCSRIYKFRIGKACCNTTTLVVPLDHVFSIKNRFGKPHLQPQHASSSGLCNSLHPRVHGVPAKTKSKPADGNFHTHACQEWF